jgi:hypothetical protein
MSNAVTEQRFDVGSRVRLLAAIGDLSEGQKGTVLVDAVDGNIEVRVDGSLDDYLIPVASVEPIIPLSRPYEDPQVADQVDVGNGLTAVQARAQGWDEDTIRMQATVTVAQQQSEAAHLKAHQPLLASLLAEGSTGDMERTRSQYGVQFVRSGTPEELSEVQGHLRGMIGDGLSYRFMERYLMSCGYLPIMIRRAFKQLTGMRAEDVVNYDNYYMSPGTIPTFSHGWGVAKGGANKGWYFVMPMTTYYGVYHQANEKSGPSPRTEVSRHPELMGAIEAARKLVRHLERWDPPVKEHKGSNVVPSELYRQPQLFMHASAGHAQVANLVSGIHSKTLRAGLIRTAFREGKVSAEERQNLMAIFADAEADAQQEAVIDRVNEVEEDLQKRPIADELAEKTPSDFFQRELLETRYVTLPANVVDMAVRYLQKVNGELRDFQILIGKFKYIPMQPSGKTSQSDEPDLLNAIVAMGVILDIYDKSVAAPNNHKRGMLTFSVIGNQIWTPDVVKGEDNRSYALSDDGLAKMFQRERMLGAGRSR